MTDHKAIAGRLDHIRAGLADVVAVLDRSEVDRIFRNKAEGQAAQLLMGAITRLSKAANKLRGEHNNTGA